VEQKGLEEQKGLKNAQNRGFDEGERHGKTKIVCSEII
jgi:hypothetical protein